MVIIAGAVLLLPTFMAEWVYYHGIVQSDALRILARWVLPAIILVVSFGLLKDWVKALIAGVISWFTNMMLLGAGLLFSLDCGGDVTASVGLSRACPGDTTVIYAFKIGIAAILCFDLFLLYRLGLSKAPKAAQKTK